MCLGFSNCPKEDAKTIKAEDIDAFRKISELITTTSFEYNKDNTKEFLDAVNLELKHSTQNEVRVIAPLINFSKKEIVKTGLDNDIPFRAIYSCYSGGNKHCGECMSCKFLKNALEENNRHDLINILF